MNHEKPDSEIDEDLLLQQDIIEGRPYSLAEAIGREGGTFLKGESTVPKLVQVITKINTFIDRNLDRSLRSTPGNSPPVG